MSANTETTEGPPKGYVECPKKCGRWTFGDGMDDLAQTECWTCIDPTGEENQSAFHKDWTPPIAAPAAHVERRKGQRWHMRNVKLGADFSGVLAEDTGATWKLSDVVAMDGGGTDRRFRADMWATPDTTMTLLADAPTEPAKSCTCPHGPSTTDGKCQIHATAGIRSSRFLGCACVKCAPPAQEAPKAAPVCQGGCGGMGLLHKGDVLERVIKGRGRILACDGYMLFMGNGAPIVGTGVLRDPAVPERLPRPQLAADWVEDCLPESGR